MAQSFYPTTTLEERIKTYKQAIKAVFESLRPLPLVYFEWPFSFSLDFIGYFGLNIDVSAGVSCSGLQAPCYLALNVFIIGVVIMLFDSSVFIFVKVSPKDYISMNMKQGLLVKSLSTVLGRNTKTLIQIVIAKLYVVDFLPYWSEINRACNKEAPGVETSAKHISSILFWILLPCVLHMIIHTFIYGLAPAKADPMFGKEVTGGGDMSEPLHFRLKPQLKTSEIEVTGSEERKQKAKSKSHVVRKSDLTVHAGDWKNIYSARICNSYYAKNLDDGTMGISFEGRIPTCTLGGFSRLSCSKVMCEGTLEELKSDDIMLRDLDLLKHDPEFWRRPDLWTGYFLHQLGRGNIFIAMGKYGETMIYKFGQLIKLSFGYWDNSLLENMQVKQRAVIMDVDRSDGTFKHETIISAMGVAHSMAWQFLPYCVFLSKMGEHLNQSPVLVFDGTPSLIIASSKERHMKYLDCKSEEGGPTEDIDEEEQLRDRGRKSLWTLEYDGGVFQKAERLSTVALNFETEHRLDKEARSDTYWIVKVPSPHVAENGKSAHVDGEGILLWFEDDETTSIPEGSTISFLEHNTEIGAGDVDRTVVHGRTLSSVEAQRVVFDTTAVYGKRAYQGKPGGNLPTVKAPLFCGKLTILVRLSSSSTASTEAPPKFKLYACYSEVPPIAFTKSKMSRTLGFCFNAKTFISKMMLVFSFSDATQRAGVAMWTLAATFLTLMEISSTAMNVILENADALPLLQDPDAWAQLKDLGLVAYYQVAFSAVAGFAFFVALISAIARMVTITSEPTNHAPTSEPTRTFEPTTTWTSTNTIRNSEDYCTTGTLWESAVSSPELWTAYCCGPNCGSCGGSGCSLRTGGSSLCCHSDFTRFCSSSSDYACRVAYLGRTYLGDTSTDDSTESSGGDDNDREQEMQSLM